MLAMDFAGHGPCRPWFDSCRCITGADVCYFLDLVPLPAQDRADNAILRRGRIDEQSNSGNWRRRISFSLIGLTRRSTALPCRGFVAARQNYLHDEAALRTLKRIKISALVFADVLLPS
jgi:hypothetical protein